jgi:hypothetical protein
LREKRGEIYIKNFTNQYIVYVKRIIESRFWRYFLSSWFLLSYFSIAIVYLVEFRREKLVHFCSCHCIGCIKLCSLWKFVGERL